MRFLIIGIQRSGTTFVSRLLSGHPDCEMFSDELKITPLFSSGIKLFGYGSETKEDINRGYVNLFDAITRKERNVSFWGAKIALANPFLAKTLVSCLNEYFTDINIIRVNRVDSVARIGSLVRAKKSGVFHSWSQNAKSNIQINFKIPQGTFKRYYLRELEIESILDQLIHPVIEVNYENDINNQNDKSKLLEKIGINKITPDWINTKKVAPNPEQYIKNYKKLAKYREKLNSMYHQGMLPIDYKIYLRLKNIKSDQLVNMGSL